MKHVALSHVNFISDHYNVMMCRYFHESGQCVLMYECFLGTKGTPYKEVAIMDESGTVLA